MSMLQTDTYIPCDDIRPSCPFLDEDRQCMGDSVESFSELAEAFYDCLNKGSKGLSKSQARSVLFDVGQNPLNQNIDDFWKQKHKKDDDVITLDELEELCKTLGDAKQVIKDALLYFDKDRNGKIDRDELHEILKLTEKFDHGFGDVDGYIDHILRLGDKNGDNMVEIDDLVMMIQDGMLTTGHR